MSWQILDGADKMELEQVMALLKQTYWADKRPAEQVKRSMENSRCFGVYLPREQKLVGFARVISDLATMYYLCDVVVDKAHRGKGMGQALVAYIEEQPEYRGLRSVLITRDTHRLYRKFGYEPLEGRAMAKGLKK